MSDNPFESPTVQSVPVATVVDHQRSVAVWSLRTTYLMLAVPALYNNFCFNRAAFTFSPLPNLPPVTSGMWVVLFGFAVLVAIAVGVLWWFFAMPVLEWIVSGLHGLFSTRPTKQQWIEVFHRSLKPVFIYGLLGGLLWGYWVFAYYQLGADFYSLSVPVAIFCNLLGAIWYIPLFIRWFTTDREYARDSR